MEFSKPKTQTNVAMPTSNKITFYMGKFQFHDQVFNFVSTNASAGELPHDFQEQQQHRIRNKKENY